MKNIIKIFLAIIILQSCSSEKNDGATRGEGTINQAFLENVKTVNPTLNNQVKELILSGKVECDPNKMVHYTPLISGVIVRSYFSSGDHVSRGQTMLHIRSAELSALQSELAVARRELQSAESMHQDKLISERELIEARAVYEKLQADLLLYGENIGGGVFAIKSPIAGFVVENNASAGSTVSEGDSPLFTVADLSTVWIIANVYAGDLQYVKQGMTVEITTLAYPGKVFSGRIDALSQVFDPEERVLKARIVMPNQDLKFKPEMPVVVRLKTRFDSVQQPNQCLSKVEGKCLSIPSDALIFDDNRHFVVLKTASENFEIREVLSQGHFQNTTFIHSGLNENDNVVVKNQLFIYQELKGK